MADVITTLSKLIDPGVPALGGGDRVLDASIKGHTVELCLPCLILVGKLPGECGDLALQVLHAHAIKGFQPFLGGLKLLLDGFIVRKRLLCRFDIPAVFGEDCVNDLLRESLIANLEIL